MVRTRGSRGIVVLLERWLRRAGIASRLLARGWRRLGLAPAAPGATRLVLGLRSAIAF